MKRPGQWQGAMGALGLGLGAVLAACSSGGPTLIERVGTLAAQRLAGPDQTAPSQQPTRQELGEVPPGTVALSVEGSPRALLAPIVENNGYLNYRDAAGNAVTMFGGAISSTQSLGEDLQAVRYHRLDPIAHPTPIADWPGRIHREYQFVRRDLDGYSIVLDCLLQAETLETVVIAEAPQKLVRVTETCTDAAHQITNTYWVEPKNGFVWKSEQWLGSALGHYTVEILRPYS